MTSHASGRHRRRLTSQIPQGLRLFEQPGAHVRPVAYPGGGISARVPGVLRGPHGAPLFRPPGTRRAVRAPAADRRTFTLTMSAGLAGVAAAVLVGSYAPLNSTWMAGRGSGAAGSGAASGPPPVNVPWSASPLSGLTGPAVPRQQSPGAGQAPASTRPLDDLAAGKGGKHRKGRARGDERNPAHHRGRPPGQPGAAGAAGTSASAPTAGSGPQVVVSYVVDREWAGGFQGQVRVVNNSTRPISGWQAVIALPADRVTWFWNADGFVSHHIMLLRPLSADEIVPAGGGTLSVFFTATGPQATPRACAFDDIPCG